MAAEEKVLKYLTLTAEPGIIGGLPQGGLNFGAALNPGAVIHQNQQFDFYDGGGLDLACLGLAQVDAQGNVNVSKFGRKLAARAASSTSARTHERSFAGTFTAGGLEVAIEDGRIAHRARRKIAQVRRGGRADHVQRRVCGRDRPARVLRHRALRVPEDASGMEFTEVAPGIDIERDILAHMGFSRSCTIQSRWTSASSASP